MTPSSSEIQSPATIIHQKYNIVNKFQAFDTKEPDDAVESVVLESKNGEEATFQFVEDLRMRFRDEYLCNLGLEGQGGVHYSMPLRIYGYKFFSYMIQKGEVNVCKALEDMVSRGKAEGEARGIVRMCQSFKMSVDEIVEKLVDMLGMSRPR